MSDRATNLPGRDDILPVIGPVIELLRSRKGILWIVGLVVMLVVAYVPRMQEVQEQLAAVLTVAFTLVTSGLILAIAGEDGAKKAAGTVPVDLGKIDFKPIWDPILALLRSRKFVAAVVAVLVSFAITNVPALADVETELAELLVFMITLIISTLIGATTYEDIKAKQPPPPRLYALPQGNPAALGYYAPVPPTPEIAVTGGPTESKRLAAPIQFEQGKPATDQVQPDDKSKAA